MTNDENTLLRWLPPTAAKAEMRAHTVIRVDGPDAGEFLQGQFSNDVRALDGNPGQLSSWNSAKGRVTAFLRVLAHDDGYWLVLDTELRDAFVQRLKLFVLRSRVRIEPSTDLDGLVVVGLAARESLLAARLPAPEPGQAIARDDLVLLGIPGPVPRIEIYGRRGFLPPLDVETASQQDLARWDVLFRLPRITTANRDEHVAQHLNLDELGAISFRKGCYTGQEIIARMKYLGKVKKRATVFLADDANVGDPVRTEDGKAAGEVVNVAPAQDGQLVLAVVNLDDQHKVLTVNDRTLARVPVAT